MVITDKNGKPAVSYGTNTAMTYGATPTDLEVTFGYGSLETVLGKIGADPDGLIAFGKDATTGSGVIVANGALASSKVLDVQVKAEVPATYYTEGDTIPEGKSVGDVKTEFVPAGLEITYVNSDNKQTETSTISISNTALENRVKALEDFNTVADSSNKISNVKDILDWFDSVSEGQDPYVIKLGEGADAPEVSLGKGQAGLLTTVAEAKNAIGVKEVSHEATEADVAAGNATEIGDKVVDTPATGLYKEIEDAVADASAAIEALDVAETTVGEGNVTFKYAQTDGLVDISTLEVKETSVTFTAAVEAAPANLSITADAEGAAEGTEAKKLLTGQAIKQIKDYVDAVAAANQEGITIAVGSEDYLSVDEDDDHKIAVKTTALGDAVGLTKGEDGKWSAADGTTSDAPGLATAADVAAEIVADEEVIAAALNEHETRIKSLEALTTSYTVADEDAPYISVETIESNGATTVTVDVSVIDSSSDIEGLKDSSADQLVSAKAVKAYVEYKLQWLNLDPQA